MECTDTIRREDSSLNTRNKTGHAVDDILRYWNAESLRISFGIEYVISWSLRVFSSLRIKKIWWRCKVTFTVFATRCDSGAVNCVVLVL